MVYRDFKEWMIARRDDWMDGRRDGRSIVKIGMITIHPIFHYSLPALRLR